jgi:pantoate--beta-alanine ligase
MTTATKIVHLDSIAAVRAQVKAWRAEGHTIGFVPTMGALHRGHVSLVEAARRRNSRVIASIFVNPTQFAPTEDLSKYPRDLPGDMQKLAGGGCHAVFTTSPEEMYPPGFATWVTVEGLTSGLCGRARPTHFRGVTTVVSKLWNIVQPDDAYLGEKDRQQLQVLKRMTKDLDLPIAVHGCPIVREADGLAMSSRNAYLSPEDRQRATALSRGLCAARASFATGERSARALEGIVKKELDAVGAKLDYVDAVDLETLATVETADTSTVIAVACIVGKTRLIDNHLLGEVFPA